VRHLEKDPARKTLPSASPTTRAIRFSSTTFRAPRGHQPTRSRRVPTSGNLPRQAFACSRAKLHLQVRNGRERCQFSGDAALAKNHGGNGGNLNSHSSARVLLRKSFAALKPCEQHRIVLLQANVQLEDQMRVLAILLGVGTAVGIAAGVSPAPAASSIQLAQAQDSAAPSGAGAGASQRGSAGNREGGNREGGAAATGGSQERGAATRPSGDPSATTRSETKRTSHTTVRERAGGTRVSVTAVLAGWWAYAPPLATMPS
jgi:hypothetical protein